MAHRYGYPLVALVRREIKKRYAATTLGLGWTFVQPIALVALYVFVFGFVRDSGSAPANTQHFVFYVLSGMLPYLAIADALRGATMALREDRALLERADFPAEVVPAARVLSATVTEAIGLAFLFVLAQSQSVPLNPWVLGLPLLVLLRTLMTFGLAWIVSTLGLFVAGFSEVLSLLLTLWLFLTPIFYATEDIPGAMQWMLAVNPLNHLVRAYRSVLVGNQAPFPELFCLIAWAALLSAVGLWFFRKTLDRGKDFL
jgi:ABC-type polysaccharide/polyol phosphate export permease